MRAWLECIDYQITDILKIMEKTAGLKVEELRTDGGATRNEYLMQFQSDLMNCTVRASSEDEVSCLGPVFAAGLKRGFFEDVSKAVEKRTYLPVMDEETRNRKLEGWKRAVARCLYKC